MEENKMNEKKHIGDGKLPNHYWVFHYNEKLKYNGEELESTNKNSGGGLLGEFKTYQEALVCVNTKAYFPHITIEDIKFTKEFIEKRGLTFK
jgi:hypothetical protein